MKPSYGGSIIHQPSVALTRELASLTCIYHVCGTLANSIRTESMSTVSDEPELIPQGTLDWVTTSMCWWGDAAGSVDLRCFTRLPNMATRNSCDDARISDLRMSAATQTRTKVLSAAFASLEMAPDGLFDNLQACRGANTLSKPRPRLIPL
jgi:hypothetical protein